MDEAKHLEVSSTGGKNKIKDVNDKADRVMYEQIEALINGLQE